MDDECGVVLVLPDLPDLIASSNIVDHAVLLSRLPTRYGNKDKALAWFESYLWDQTQCVRIQRVKSSTQDLKYRVLQGSALGCNLFPIYSLPLSDIIRKLKLEFELYVDDDQLYMVF